MKLLQLPANWIRSGAVVLAFTATSAMFGQGLTTSGLSGFVTDKDGNGISGATVTVVNDLTGSRSTATTRSTGQYSVSGVASGGPYTVTATSPGLPPEEKKGVFLTLGATAAVNLELSTEVVKLEAYQVSEQGTNTSFDSSVMGTGSNFSSKDITQIESVRRDLQDIENIDPRAVVMQVSASDPAYEFSVAGQNPRENALLIDGVSAADNFGLNSNGYAGLRNPVPLDWISSLTLEINPFDVVYSGFLGGLTDVDLKSGTNEVHGSAYEIYTGTSFRGPDPNVGLLGPHESLQQHTTGFTLGGPILKDRLFLFVGYEAFRQLAAPPAQLFNPLASSTGTTQLDEIVSTLESRYSFDPGALSAASSHTWEQNFVAKLNWDISDTQKFIFTFRHTIGDAPVFYNYTGASETSFETSWYNSNRSDQSYTAQLNSDWSHIIPNFHTEVEATYKRYNGTASLNGPKEPALLIEGVSGYSEPQAGIITSGEIFAGTYYAYQDNNIYTWEQEEHAYGDYSIGNHTFKFGTQFDRTSYTDTFIPYYIGSYTYSTVANFLSNTPVTSTKEIPAAGFTLAEDVSHYYLLDIAPLLQDTWKPNSQLTILGGLRMDYPYLPQSPIASAVFYKAYGFSNDTSMNGNYVISPRVGFNYTFHTALPTQVRGGAGLFLGQNPVVWVENSYNNAGQLNTVTNGVASSAAPSFDYTDPHFHWPANWKENLAVDKTLPFLGIIATAEVDLTEVEKDVFYQETNPYALPTSGPLTMPDGRLRFAGAITPGTASSVGAYALANAPTGYYASITSSPTVLYQNHGSQGVYELTNTDKGGSQEYTLELNRPVTNGWGFELAFTYTHATQVGNFSSSVASSGFLSTPNVNPNDNIAYRSQYAVPEKFVATLTRQFDFFKLRNSKTSISAQFITQTGQAYSFVYHGNANGDGNSDNSDLFYVPSGPSDPRVEWISATEEANFFNYLSLNPQLAKWAGQIAPRNSAYAPWQEALNLHAEQQIPIWRSVRVTLFGDCYNFSNLIDKHSGIVDDFTGSFETQEIAGTGYDTKTNKYIYTFNRGTLGVPTIYSDLSRWQVEVGARLEF